MSSISFPDLIRKKRDKEELTDEEIQVFTDGVVNGTMAECQMGAMLMAIYLNNLTHREIASLTREVKNSGTTLTWPPEWSKDTVDKHSTGGVGDKVSIVLAPALAAAGRKVPMISGRGLGHTGGTLDKLESIPGFNVSVSNKRMSEILSTVGCFIGGQTGEFCPADKKLYSLRDVTSTVKHIGLITASIVSKKAAENVSTLVLDVKTGSGAFMQDPKEAKELAHSMVSCSNNLGTKTVALMTDMDSPIGNMVGNALEVVESIHCLQGKECEDLLDLIVVLGSHLLHTGGFVKSIGEGNNVIKKQITSGAALAKFCAMIKAQGVEDKLANDLCDPQVDIWTLLKPSKHRTDFQCPQTGYVKRIDAMDIAVVVHKLGGGRNVPSDPVNWAVGVELLVDIGDKVEKGQPWVKVHHDSAISAEVKGRLEHALEISSHPVKARGSRLQGVIIE